MSLVHEINVLEIKIFVEYFTRKIREVSQIYGYTVSSQFIHTNRA